MSDGPELRTKRLLLRRWRTEDHAPFARMNADPLVMEHFPTTLTSGESEDMIRRLETGFERDGYGFWAVQVGSDGGPLAGFVGLSPVERSMAFAPAVEIGWRLAGEHWGQGIAAEAATAALGFGFGELGLGEIVAYTAAGNLRSQRLMQRLGMRHDTAMDFAHPEIAPEHPLSAHVLYRIAA